jgi:hypothetical protein
LDCSAKTDFNKLSESKIQLNRKQFYLCFSVELIFLFTFLFQTQEEILNVSKIQTCGNYLETGYFCSTCGVTRSFYAFLNFRFQLSWNFNYVGFMMAFSYSINLIIGVFCLFDKKYFKYRKLNFIISSITIFSALILRWLELNIF